MSDQKRLNFLRNAVEKAPDAEMPRYGLAMALMNMDDLAESEDHFKQLLETHATYVPGHFQFGKLLAKAGRIDEARAALEHGIEVATEVGNMHAAGEMQEELDMLE